MERSRRLGAVVPVARLIMALSLPVVFLAVACEVAAPQKPPPTATVSVAPTQKLLPSATPPLRRCHPSYEGACLDPNASDYDCRGGSGDGPLYTGVTRESLLSIYWDFRRSRASSSPK